MRRKVIYPIFFSGREASSTTSQKPNIQNDFNTGNDWYPKTRQDTLHFLDKYRKSAIVSQLTSEGAEFSQKGGNKYQCRYKKTYDKNYRKTKKRFKCDKEGHPASHYPEGNKKDGKKKRSNFNKSRDSQSSK